MKNIFLLLLTFAAVLSFPVVHMAQAPDLGTASTYALFTAEGAITNVGATAVTGDVGTNAGSITGTPPPVINGSVHQVDPASQIAAGDVLDAYDELTGINCQFSLLTPIISQTLTPGVYCVGPATITGNLILDGQNNPNAIFIFKIGGALTTSSFVNISVINQATLKNVYWHVGGQFDLGTNSVFRGTLLVAGAVHLLTNSTLEGRALSTAGVITLDNNSVTNAEAVVLPVTLMNFSATRKGGTTLLAWSTASEQNSKNFVVERNNTVQANTWKTIGILKAAGSSTSRKQYTFIDNSVNKGVNYYRLRSTDLSGRYNISGVELVYFDAPSSMGIRIFPNPMKSRLIVTGAPTASIIRLLDISGKRIMEQPASGYGSDEVETGRLPAGSYLLKIIPVSGNATIIKLNKQ